LTPHELLDRVRRRTLELLIADDGDLDYRTAERQAARELATLERLKPQTVAPPTTPVQEHRGADPKTQLLRKLEAIARCLSEPLGQAAGSAGVDQARNHSLAERLALLPTPRRLNIIQTLTNEQALDVFHDWQGFWARAKQLAPSGDWSTWVLRAGRGFGKTRTGAGWVQERALQHPGRWIALVARTPADARDYMIEGPGGFLRNAHPRLAPVYEVSKRRLTWPNGSWGTIYSDDEPDQLRGFSGDTAWLDEFAKFQNPEETWTNLEFGMREASNDRPRKVVTTTPRPIPILKRIERLPSTVVVTGTSHENRSNLDPRWFADTISRHEATRIGRQEIRAEILEDVPGALWTRAMLDQARLDCGVIDGIRRASPRARDYFDDAESTYAIGIA
jgi:hypothetical protein